MFQFRKFERLIRMMFLSGCLIASVIFFVEFRDIGYPGKGFLVAAYFWALLFIFGFKWATDQKPMPDLSFKRLNDYCMAVFWEGIMLTWLGILLPHYTALLLSRKFEQPMYAWIFDACYITVPVVALAVAALSRKRHNAIALLAE